MRISPHLMFDGQCAEAFDCYHRLLGGELRTLKFGDSPMAADLDPRWHDRLVHATLQIGRFELAGADVLPDDYREPQGFSVLLSIDDADRANEVFAAFGDGGHVVFPIQETFWAARFGVVVDRYGIPWEINCARASAH